MIVTTLPNERPPEHVRGICRAFHEETVPIHEVTFIEKFTNLPHDYRDVRIAPRFTNTLREYQDIRFLYHGNNILRCSRILVLLYITMPGYNQRIHDVSVAVQEDRDVLELKVHAPLSLAAPPALAPARARVRLRSRPRVTRSRALLSPRAGHRRRPRADSARGGGVRGRLGVQWRITGILGGGRGEGETR